jgi:hypothetical protein
VFSAYEKVAPLAVVTPKRRPPSRLSHSVSGRPSPSTSMVVLAVAPRGIDAPGVGRHPRAEAEGVDDGVAIADGCALGFAEVPPAPHPASPKARVAAIATIPDVMAIFLGITSR